MASRRITVLGARPNRAIGPPGLHIRWMFPPALGFPGDGFEVFRRPADPGWKAPLLDFTDLPVGRTLIPGETIGMATLHFHRSAQLEPTPTGSLRVVRPGIGPMRVSFGQPVARVLVVFSGPNGPVNLRALVDGRVVNQSDHAEITPDGQYMRISASHIDEVLFPLAFAELIGVGVQTETEVCEAADWQRVAKIKLLKPANTAEAEQSLRERFEPKLRNCFASTRDAALARYRERLPEIIHWQQALQNPQSSIFTDPAEPRPDQLKVATSADQQRGFYQETFPQSLLLLAALDPNIARLLGLYWADAYGRGPDPPEPDISFDYRVLGHWPNLRLCGLLFDLGAAESGLPRMSHADPPVEASRIPGVRWAGTVPLSRVGLRWPRSPSSSDVPSPVQPVLFDIHRENALGGVTDGQGIQLTKNHPVLVPASSWTTPGAALFVDPAVPLGRFRYRIRGIDLFGQISEPVVSKAVELLDLDAPPPPVRLRGALRQPDYPWNTPQQRAVMNEPTNLEFSFEYGAMQHQQAPDARSFQIFWRQDSLVDTVRAEVLNVEDGDGGNVVRIQALDDDEQLRFAGGRLSNAPPSTELDTAVPAAQRRHFRVAEIVGNDGLRLVHTPNEDLHVTPGGPYWLHTDPRNSHAWQWTGRRVDVRPPATGVVLNSDADQQRVLANGRRLSLNVTQPDPFTLLEDRRPADLVAPPTGLAEILLDRQLLEDNLFAGGTVQVQGSATQYPIEQSSAGPAHTLAEPAASSRAARIWVRDDGRLPTGPDLDLILHVPTLTGGSAVAPGSQPPASTTGTAALRPAAAWVRCVRLSGTFSPNETPISGVDSSVRSGPGGEIAFDAMVDGQQVTRIARVVSATHPVQANFEILVRARDTEDLPPTGAHCRYYAPYEVQMRIGLGGDALSDLQLPIPHDAGRRNAYLALLTVDLSRDSNDDPPVSLPANIGPLSTPLQVVAVQPPPTGQPDAPVPFGSLDLPVALDMGYASPPDRQGRATVHLEWRTGSVHPTAGLRYELARASDNGLLATDRRNWLVGRGIPGLPPLDVLVTAASTTHNGRTQVTIQPQAAVTPETLAGLLGGLLVQGDHISAIVTEPVAVTAGLAVTVEPEAGAAQPEAGTARLFPLPILPGLVVPGTLNRPNPAPIDGPAPVRATFIPDGGTELPFERLVGGRVQKPRSATTATPGNQTAYYQITGAEPALGGTTLLLLPLGAPDPIGSDEPCFLQTPPDYSRMRAEHAKFRQLGDKPTNEDAFGLATGAPIGPKLSDPHPLAFRDEVPGQGRNRFFYRVRAVDTAENRSAWSATSAAFNQADTTPPAAPDNFRVVPGNRRASLLWNRPAEPNIGTYRIYRQVGVDGAVVPTEVYRSITSAEAVPPPLRVIAGGLSLPTNVDDVEIEAIEIRPADAAPGTPNMFTDRTALTTVSGRTIRSLNPLVEDGTPVVVLVSGVPERRPLIQRASGEPLTVRGGQVELDDDLTLDDLLGVYRLSDPTNPRQALSSIDLRIIKISAVRRNVHGRISGLTGLNPLLRDGTAVTVKFRLADGGERIFEVDTSMLAWEDSNVDVGITYYYHLAAVEIVDAASVRPDDSPVTVFVASPIAGPISVVGVDRSPATPPALANLAWIDPANGELASPSTSLPAVLITIEQTVPPAAYLVQRRASDAAHWTNVRLQEGAGWRPWPSGEASLQVLDPGATPTISWTYRAQVRTADGRVSANTPPVALAALTQR